MLSLAQGRVPRDTVISLWRTRLPAQLQIMVMNYKEESELLKSADMAYDVLQQSHINALKTPTSAPVIPEDVGTQIFAALRDLQSYTGQKRRSRSNSRDKRNSSPATSSSGSRDNKKSLCWYHSRFGEEARYCYLPYSWKRAPGQD